MNRGFKFLIQPTKDQQQKFINTFGCCRFVWNKILNDRQEAYKQGIKFNKTLAQYKTEFPFLKDVDSLALNATANHVNFAYKNFFEKRAKFPKFKSKKRFKQTYTTNNLYGSTNSKGSIQIKDNKIKIPKVGWVKIKLHRQLPKDYEIKHITISYYSGKFYVSINVQYEPQIVSKKLDVQNSIGLDYKSDGLYVDNQGNKPDYPKFFRLYESKLAFEQRKLSHMKRGSSNYNKQKLKVAKIHEKIANCRKDFLHKVSYSLANTYDYVFVEDLNMQSISKFLKLGKSTYDNGFGIFKFMLNYKLQDRGKVFHKIDKWYASSTTCSNCGAKHKDIVSSLSIRKWTCPTCVCSHDRDINAAINIRNRGIKETVGTTGLACECL